MRNLASNFTDIVEYLLQNWALPLAIVLGTLAAVAVARWFLQRIARTRHLAPLTELAAPASNLIYAVGLKMCVESLPLRPATLAWLDSGVYVLGVFLFLVLVRRFALLAVEWSTARSTNSATLQQGFIPLMRNLITLFVFLSGAIMILQHFHYDVLSLLTALGVGSLAVGLAAKETLSNMISGFTLIIDKNLRPGDRINLAGTIGAVGEIGLRSTRIRTDNGNTLIVPNSDMVNTRIINISQPSRSVGVTTTVRFPVDVPFPKIRSLCLEVVAGLGKTANDKTPCVSLGGLSDGVQTVSISFWVQDLSDEGAALSDFHERLLERLRAEDLKIAVLPGTTFVKP